MGFAHFLCSVLYENQTCKFYFGLLLYVKDMLFFEQICTNFEGRCFFNFVLIFFHIEMFLNLMSFKLFPFFFQCVVMFAGSSSSTLMAHCI